MAVKQDTAIQESNFQTTSTKLRQYLTEKDLNQKRKHPRVYSLFSRASDVAEAVHGKVKFRAAANDSRADLLEISGPHELHPQDVRVGSPLRAGERQMSVPHMSQNKSKCRGQNCGCLQAR